MLFASVSTGSLGFPRMGPNRELKFALETYWKTKDNQKDALRLLQTVAHHVETAAWQLQLKAGLDHITVGDHYLYDGVLTWTNLLGICPRRFQSMEPGIDRMFAMARGVDGAEALGTYFAAPLLAIQQTHPIEEYWVRHGVSFLSHTYSHTILVSTNKL